jgi:hypothetical protein
LAGSARIAVLAVFSGEVERRATSARQPGSGHAWHALDALLARYAGRTYIAVRPGLTIHARRTARAGRAGRARDAGLAGQPWWTLLAVRAVFRLPIHARKAARTGQTVRPYVAAARVVLIALNIGENQRKLRERNSLRTKFRNCRARRGCARARADDLTNATNYRNLKLSH